MDLDKYTKLLQWHNGVELFDYNPTVDWAIGMIQKGVETENMLILSSFSKPVNREEIKSYVSAVLKDLSLEEKVTEFSLVSNCYYHVRQILDDNEKRKSLSALYSFHLANNSVELTLPFYLLYLGWSDLEKEGFNFYYAGATLKNIEAILELECHKFIEQQINKDERKTEDFENKLNKIRNTKQKTKSNFWRNFICKFKDKDNM